MTAWLEFHQRRAALYSLAAQADPGHQHEARYLASVEREAAERVSGALGSGDGQSSPMGSSCPAVEDQQP